MISSILWWNERPYSYTLISDPQYSFGIGDHEEIDISSPSFLEEEFLHLIFIGQRQKETLATPKHMGVIRNRIRLHDNETNISSQCL